jgi:hypothetical protein
MNAPVRQKKKISYVDRVSRDENRHGGARQNITFPPNIDLSIIEKFNDFAYMCWEITAKIEKLTRFDRKVEMISCAYDILKPVWSMNNGRRGGEKREGLGKRVENRKKEGKCWEKRVTSLSNLM